MEFNLLINFTFVSLWWSSLGGVTRERKCDGASFVLCAVRAVFDGAIVAVVGEVK